MVPNLDEQNVSRRLGQAADRLASGRGQSMHPGQRGPPGCDHPGTGAADDLPARRHLANDEHRSRYSATSVEPDARLALWCPDLVLDVVARSAIIDCTVASITIRDLDETTKERLRVRAARHRRSMEEEVRSILRAVAAEPETRPSNLAEAIRARFRPFGGVVLRLPPREPIREPPGRGE
jgi:plasmid stability protein